MKKFLLVIFVFLTYVATAQAEVLQCGQTIIGGTASNYRTINLTQSLSCSNSVGLKFSSPYVSLYCNGLNISNVNGTPGGIGVSITASNIYLHECNISGWKDSGVYARGPSAGQSISNIFTIGYSNVFNNNFGIRLQYCNNCWTQDAHFYNNTASGINMQNTLGGGVWNVESNNNGAYGIRLFNATSPWLGRPYLHNNTNEDFYFTGSYQSVATHLGYVLGDGYYVGKVRFDNGANNNQLHCVSTASVTHGQSTSNNTFTCP